MQIRGRGAHSRGKGPLRRTAAPATIRPSALRDEPVHLAEDDSRTVESLDQAATHAGGGSQHATFDRRSNPRRARGTRPTRRASARSRRSPGRRFPCTVTNTFGAGEPFDASPMPTRRVTKKPLSRISSGRPLAGRRQSPRHQRADRRDRHGPEEGAAYRARRPWPRASPLGPRATLIASWYRKSRPYAYPRSAFVRRTTRALIAAITKGPVHRPTSRSQRTPIWSPPVGPAIAAIGIERVRIGEDAAYAAVARRRLRRGASCSRPCRR